MVYQSVSWEKEHIYHFCFFFSSRTCIGRKCPTYPRLSIVCESPPHSVIDRRHPTLHTLHVGENINSKITKRIVFPTRIYKNKMLISNMKKYFLSVIFVPVSPVTRYCISACPINITNDTKHFGRSRLVWGSLA